MTTKKALYEEIEKLRDKITRLEFEIRTQEIMTHADRMLHIQTSVALKEVTTKNSNLMTQLAEAYEIIESLLSKLSDSGYKRQMSERKKDLENS